MKILIITVSIIITFHVGAQTTYDSSSYFEEIILKYIDQYLKTSRKEDGLSEKELYILTIGEFSLEQRMLEFSISYILTQEDFFNVKPKKILKIKNHFVLLRHADNQTIPSLSHFEDINGEIREECLKKLAPSKILVAYEPMYVIVKVHNDKEELEWTYDEWNMDAKFLRRDYYFTNMENIEIDTISSEEFNKRMMGTKGE